MKKYTSKKLREARENADVKKWRASGRNGTIIPNPTVAELKSREQYQQTCNDYVRLLIRSIVEVEKRLYNELELKCKDYYTNRYDVTAVENIILRNAILNKL